MKVIEQLTPEQLQQFEQRIEEVKKKFFELDEQLVAAKNELEKLLFPSGLHKPKTRQDFFIGWNPNFSRYSHGDGHYSGSEEEIQSYESKMRQELSYLRNEILILSEIESYLSI